MVITLSILFISILLSEIIINKLIKKDYSILNTISIFLIIINFIIFTYLTYNPYKSYLFYDTESNKYGIDILNKWFSHKGIYSFIKININFSFINYLNKTKSIYN